MNLVSSPSSQRENAQALKIQSSLVALVEMSGRVSIGTGQRARSPASRTWRIMVIPDKAVSAC